MRATPLLARRFRKCARVTFRAISFNATSPWPDACLAANRLDSLSWSAHAVVARLDSEHQRQMLKRASEQGWTSEELRRQVQRRFGRKR